MGPGLRFQWVNWTSIFAPKSNKSLCSGDKTFDCQISQLLSIQHSAINHWSSRPRKTCSWSTIYVRSKWHGRTLAEKPRKPETSVSFLILVLFDKQAVEHSVFKRTSTRNSFDYSQSGHRNHKICVMTPFQWILPWFNTPSQPWRQRRKRWIPQSKSTATHYRAAGINTWNIQCVTYYNTRFLARNIRIWTTSKAIQIA